MVGVGVSSRVGGGAIRGTSGTRISLAFLGKLAFLRKLAFDVVDEFLDRFFDVHCEGSRKKDASKWLGRRKNKRGSKVEPEAARTKVGAESGKSCSHVVKGLYLRDAGRL